MDYFYSRFQTFLGVIILLLTFTLVGCAGEPGVKPKKLLVVTVTKGFRHDSIPTAEKVIAELGSLKQSFTVDYARTDEDLATKTTPQGLKKYDGVVFASTTGDIPLPDREAFLDWIKDGHAFIGLHAATDTFHGYRPYIEMIGGEFASHGPQLKVRLISEDPEHAATKPFNKTSPKKLKT